MDIKEATQTIEQHYLNRNQHILTLSKLGVPQAEIARQLKVSRQRVNQIIKRSKTTMTKLTDKEFNKLLKLIKQFESSHLDRKEQNTQQFKAWLEVNFTVQILQEASK